MRSRHDPEVAEIAFVVADDLQHQGLGTALAKALADAARERGVRRFVATMLPDNLAAHRLFAHVAQHRETSSGVGEPDRGVAVRRADLEQAPRPHRADDHREHRGRLGFDVAKAREPVGLALVVLARGGVERIGEGAAAGVVHPRDCCGRCRTAPARTTARWSPTSRSPP